MSKAVIVDAAGRHVAGWVVEQIRLREIVARNYGRFTLGDMPVIRLADYHRPDLLIPRLPLDPSAN